MNTPPAMFFSIDLITPILSFLTVKSLTRFRCVCKSWNSLISEPSFVKLHLHHSKRNNPHITLLLQFGSKDIFSVVIPFPLTRLLENPSITITHDSNHLSTKNECKNFVGSSNGLLCFRSNFSYSGGDILLRFENPATKLSNKIRVYDSNRKRSRLEFLMSSKKSDTNALDRPKRDWLNPKPNRLKPLPDWLLNPRSERPMSKEYHEFVLSQCYKGVEDLINQSPYDATPPTFNPRLFGGNPVFAIDITDEVRPILEKLSHLALEYYNNNNKEEGSGSSFEFHDLVKCARWSDRRNPFADYRPLDPTEYYITFQAKSKGDTCSSSSPAITIFQAKVLVDKDDQDKTPVVEECRIKI
ncbi:F-box/kelch-repeat protein [Trifolium repens]|nr:F-box/kelch-repeat protein [Trifolium repens]